jgi:general secretion pathway protein B
MSYILDALRRADSERERGSVPSIHAQPMPQASSGDARSRRGNPRVLVGVIVALSLALAGTLAWHLMAGPDVPRAVAEPGTQPPAPAPVAIQEEAPPPPAPAVTAMVPAAPVRTAPVMPAAPPAAFVPPPPQPPRAQARVQTQPPVTAGDTVKIPTNPPPVPVTNADNRVYAQHELPEDIRRDLPKLVIGGAMYSDTPANRMLIINSQIFHEGDKLSPDLLLEEIKLKSAVLKYKGYRYAVSY